MSEMESRISNEQLAQATEFVRDAYSKGDAAQSLVHVEAGMGGVTPLEAQVKEMPHLY